MYDFERGAKVTGRKFYFTSGNDAIEEWNLITDMIRYHTDRGYKFIIPPYLVKPEIADAAGITRLEGDYYVTTEGLVLIPTAEVALVGLHSDEILDEAELPRRYCAFSPCFRKEAGAGGARDSGLRRVHQFHKVELFVICKPEDSEVEHQNMLLQVQAMLTTLHPQLEYRTVELTKEDRSPLSNKTWDIELKFQNEWLEVSSISNMGDNQAKRAQVRYRPKNGGKPIKCHMLNGSGVALPRLVLALNQ